MAQHIAAHYPKPARRHGPYLQEALFVAAAIVMVALLYLLRLPNSELLLGLIINLQLFVLLSWFRQAPAPTGLLSPSNLYYLSFFAYIFVSTALILLPLPGNPYYEYFPIDGRTLLCFSLAILGFAAGFRVDRRMRLWRFLPSPQAVWDRKAALLTASAVILLGLGLLSLLVFRIGLGTYMAATYLDTYAFESGQGYLSAGYLLVELGIYIWLLAVEPRGLRNKIVPLALYALLSLFFLRLGRRRVVMEIGLGLLVIVHARIRPIKLRTLTLAALLVVPIFALIGTFRFYMQEGVHGIVAAVSDEYSNDLLWRAADETTSVPNSVARTIEFIPDVEPYRYGMSYFNSFLILAPQQLYPDRPQSSGEWFAYIYDPEVAGAGGGFGYSWIAEGYLNFGYAGVFAALMALGVIVGAFTEYGRAGLRSQGKLLIYASFCTLPIQLVRGEIAGFMKIGIVAILVPAMLAAVWLEHSSRWDWGSLAALRQRQRRDVLPVR